MTFTIRPYVRIDGIPTFRDSEIRNLYHLMERDGTAKVVFCNGVISNKDDFLNHINSNNTVLYVAMSDTPLGIGWINNFENKTARAHFCIFSEGWPDSVNIGKALVSSAVQFGDLEMLIGMIPLWNGKAIQFGLKCGAKMVGIFPSGSLYETGESCPTAILYYPRSA